MDQFGVNLFVDFVALALSSLKILKILLCCLIIEVGLMNLFLGLLDNVIRKDGENKNKLYEI